MPNDEPTEDVPFGTPDAESETTDETATDEPRIDAQIDLADAVVEDRGREYATSQAAKEQLESLMADEDISEETDPEAIAAATPGATEADIEAIREEYQERGGPTSGDTDPDTLPGADSEDSGALDQLRARAEARERQQAAGGDDGDGSDPPDGSAQAPGDDPGDDDDGSDDTTGGDDADAESGQSTDSPLMNKVRSARDDYEEEKAEAEESSPSDFAVDGLAESEKAAAQLDEEIDYENQDFSTFEHGTPTERVRLWKRWFKLSPPDEDDVDDEDNFEDVMMNLQETFQEVTRGDPDEVPWDDIVPVMYPVVAMIVERPDWSLAEWEQKWEKWDDNVKESLTKKVLNYAIEYVGGFTIDSDDLRNLGQA